MAAAVIFRGVKNPSLMIISINSCAIISTFIESDSDKEDEGEEKEEEEEGEDE